MPSFVSPSCANTCIRPQNRSLVLLLQKNQNILSNPMQFTVSCSGRRDHTLPEDRNHFIRHYFKGLLFIFPLSLHPLPCRRLLLPSPPSFPETRPRVERPAVNIIEKANLIAAFLINLGKYFALGVAAAGASAHRPGGLRGGCMPEAEAEPAGDGRGLLRASEITWRALGYCGHLSRF